MTIFSTEAASVRFRKDVPRGGGGGRERAMGRRRWAGMGKHVKDQWYTRDVKYQVEEWGFDRVPSLLSDHISSLLFSFFSHSHLPVDAISSLPVDMRKYMGLLGLGHLRSAPVNCLSMSLTPFCRVPS